MKVQLDPEGIAAYEAVIPPYRDKGFWGIGSTGVRCARPGANGSKRLRHETVCNFKTYAFGLLNQQPAIAKTAHSYALEHLGCQLKNAVQISCTAFLSGICFGPTSGVVFFNLLEFQIPDAIFDLPSPKLDHRRR